jgi:hypothetical protein
MSVNWSMVCETLTLSCAGLHIYVNQGTDVSGLNFLLRSFFVSLHTMCIGTQVGYSTLRTYDIADATWWNQQQNLNHHV